MINLIAIISFIFYHLCKRFTYSKIINLISTFTSSLILIWEYILIIVLTYYYQLYLTAISNGSSKWYIWLL